MSNKKTDILITFSYDEYYQMGLKMVKEDAETNDVENNSEQK